jgi:hypothetical protein
MQDRQQSEAPKYWAFISYSHHDSKWGTWLHRCLDTYRVPKKLLGRVTADGPLPRRLFPIFRDREELAASPNLPDRITEALEQSRYLIVICSPHARQSQWVNEEVRTFKKLGREDRIFGLIVDGEPNANDAGVSVNQDCFPDAMRHRIASDGTISTEKAQPLVPDVRPGKDGRTNAILKLLAGILGVSFDTLKRREDERRIRRRMWIITGAVVLMLAFGTLGVNLFYQQQEAQRATQVKQSAMTDSFFRTIGVSSENIPTRDEREALWELAQLDQANADVRRKVLNLWFENDFMRGEAGGGQGFRAATGLNVEYHRLATSEAAELGNSLAADLESRQQTAYEWLSRDSDGLVAVANMMKPQAAAKIAKRLAAALDNPQETDSYRLSSLGDALAALANTMESQAAEKIATRGAKRLAAALLENPQETDFERLSKLGDALAALANTMEPRAAAEIANGLAAALDNPQETDSDRLSGLGDALATVLNKVKPQAAAEIATRVAKRLAAALDNPRVTDSGQLSSLGHSPAAVVNKLEPQTLAIMAIPHQNKKRLTLSIITTYNL